MTTTTSGLDVYRRELLKGSTETLIMSLLADQEMYGYQLAKEMERRSGGYFHLKEGTVPRPAQAGARRPDRWALGTVRIGPESQVLQRKPRGMDRLDAMLAEWNTFSDAVNRIAKPANIPAYVA